MKAKKIYVSLQGRIGNQLFIYALARKLQLEKQGYEIIIDDSEVIRCKWVNSLTHYNIQKVRFEHSNVLKTSPSLMKQRLLRKGFRIISRKKTYFEKYDLEKKYQSFFNKNGLIMCENGYLPVSIPENVKNVYISGFFQSAKYFDTIKDVIKKEFKVKEKDLINNYPHIDILKNRNTVCISIKVEHNVGNDLYDVCTLKYWKKAIEYINSNVEDPLYFICSDNVDYVLENLIDVSKFDYICQEKEMPVHVSLEVMSLCKHFIIGNTTFGWWAQYLSDCDEKIVIAPSKWMKIEMPIDIYQDNWVILNV